MGTSTGTRTKILFVDDDRSFLTGIRLVLERNHPEFECTFAGNGTEALGLLAEGPYPDLVVCDAMMPDVDGYQVLEQIRQRPETALIPFIFLTGLDDIQDIRRGMEKGADDYLPKPVSPAEIVKAVRTRLAKQRIIEQNTRQSLDELRNSIILSLPHELKTPLTVIKMYSHVINDNLDSLAIGELRDMAQAIRDSSNRLERLVENYLLYAQLVLMNRENPVEGKREGIRIDHPARVVTEAARERAEVFGREGDLHLDLADAPVAVKEENLAKIVQEVVDNAFKFSSPQQPVRLAAASHPQGYRIRIADEGIGMTPEQTARVDAFLQFDRVFHEQQGQGLGLGIARRLAQYEGGRLEVSSSPKQGTTILIELPLAE
jgi:two-component system sensor histidine kinase/response regulator